MRQVHVILDCSARPQKSSSLLSCCPALDSADRSAALNHEITSGAKSMLQAAKSSLPLIKRRSCKKKFIDDETLRVKCTISKASWHTWRNLGRPRSGPVYDEMCRCKKAVKSYIYSCRACEERARLQECDCLFSNRDQRHFTIPRRSISHHKLSVGGKIITDKPQLMHCWTQHFNP